ncbi:hypothetical protein HDV63DRAFT_261537 [Trichoderma sp. SZMC 28014]
MLAVASFTAFQSIVTGSLSAVRADAGLVVASLRWPKDSQVRGWSRRSRLSHSQAPSLWASRIFFFYFAWLDNNLTLGCLLKKGFCVDQYIYVSLCTDKEP